MIGTYSAEYKALTAPQKAKVRKAIAAYEAERNPIMYEVNRYERELHLKAYRELNCQERAEQAEAIHSARIQEIREEMSRLNDELRILTKEAADASLEIKSEPYRVVAADPKAIALHDVWSSINKRHEAKMAELLASFKTEEGVA